ncbi:hypothetical protein, conserved, partial [Eimeria maxima]
MEKSLPYGGEYEEDKEPTTLELYKIREKKKKLNPPHRFIVTAPAGYVEKAGIK